MKVFTFSSKLRNEVIVVIEDNLDAAIKVLNQKYISKDIKDDYIIGSSVSAIKGYSCSIMII